MLGQEPERTLRRLKTKMRVYERELNVPERRIMNRAVTAGFGNPI